MDLFRFDPPDLTDDQARHIAHEHYGIAGATRRLRGERSHNTLFSCDDGRQFVLKVASAGERGATIEFHALALAHIEQRAPELPVARMCPSRTGELVPRIEHDGRCHAVRLVTFLPGVTFDDDQTVSDLGLEGIGELLGAIATALADFDHPSGADFMPWDIANGVILDESLWNGLRESARRVAERGRDRLLRATEAMAALPRQIIHNDGHAGNLLRADESSDRVTGLIDFGDLVRTVTAADIGVAAANLVPHQADPAGALAALTAGFHSRRPLSDAEIDAVPDLVLARLTLSTLLIEYQIANAPHIAESVATELPGVVANLDRWLAVDPASAAERIKEQL